MQGSAQPAHGIQLVCPAGLVSGKEIVSLVLASGLRERGFDIRFMISVWGDGEFPRQLDAAGFAYERIPLGFISLSLRREIVRMTRGQLQRWPELARNYRRILHETRPRAVIHTNWHHALLLLPWLKPKQDIYWAHDLVPETQRYKWIFRALAARIGRVVCVSHAVERNLLALGVSPSRLVVVHNGVSIAGTPSRRMASSPLRVAIIGQIAEWKGHDDLFEAVSLLARQGVSIELSIFGSGASDYVRKLRAQAQKFGIEGAVHWRGFVTDRSIIYSQIDVCVVPSRSEDPLPTVAIEAASFGCPVVCSGLGGLAEIVEDGETGFIVEPMQPSQIAEALAKFSEKPSLLQTMGEAARRRAHAEFSQAAFVDRFVHVLQRLGA